MRYIAAFIGIVVVAVIGELLRWNVVGVIICCLVISFLAIVISLFSAKPQ